MSPSWTFLNAECKSDMKRLACSQVYLPSSQNDGELPYRKPCKFLCDATSYLGTSCAGMMEGFGTAVNCYDDSVFDQTNNLDECNAMGFTEDTLLVAHDQEPYVGQLCQGVFDTAIATPGVTDIDPNFAPYLPPYVAQSITETALGGWIASLPTMAHGSCLTDFRKMACGLMLPIADVTNMLDFIFGPISMPSFPHQSVCQNFMQSCEDTLSVIPALGMNCSAEVGNIALFPTETQTITSMNLGFGDILLQSDPNTMENATVELLTECPYLLVVPDEPSGKHVNWIDGYNCAMECQLEIYVEEFAENYFIFFKFTQWFSLSIISLALMNLQILTSAPKRNRYLQIVLGVLWMQSFLTILLIQNRTQEDVMCKDNAQYYSFRDSSSYTNAFTCTSAATFQLIHDNTLYFMFIAMTSELFSRVILEAKSVDVHKIFYVYVAGMLMLGLTLMQLFYPEAKDVTPVHGGWALTCTWQYEDPMLDYWMFTLPRIIIYVTCSTMSIFTAYRTLQVTRAVSGSFQKMWKSYRVLYVSVILFVGTFPLLLFMDKTYYQVGMKDKLADSMQDWFVCIITEFISGNEEYKSFCGSAAKYHYPYAALYVLLAFYYILTPIGNLWASFSKEAREKWYDRIVKMRAIIAAGRNREVKVLPTTVSVRVIDISNKASPPSTERDDSDHVAPPPVPNKCVVIDQAGEKA